MNVLLPIATVQSLVFIPRESSLDITLVITNEETETATTLTPAVSNSNGYMTALVIYSFDEGSSYSYEVTDTASGDLLYRGKIFATAQTDIENYNINNDLLQA